jgi:hypothetical protein
MTPVAANTHIDRAPTVARLVKNVGRVIVGKADAVGLMLVALARGHEGV